MKVIYRCPDTGLRKTAYIEVSDFFVGKSTHISNQEITLLNDIFHMWATNGRIKISDDHFKLEFHNYESSRNWEFVVREVIVRVYGEQRMLIRDEAGDEYIVEEDGATKALSSDAIFGPYLGPRTYSNQLYAGLIG